jgi:hypothetical protein
MRAIDIIKDDLGIRRKLLIADKFLTRLNSEDREKFIKFMDIHNEMESCYEVMLISLIDENRKLERLNKIWMEQENKSQNTIHDIIGNAMNSATEQQTKECLNSYYKTLKSIDGMKPLENNESRAENFKTLLRGVFTRGVKVRKVKNT